MSITKSREELALLCETYKQTRLNEIYNLITESMTEHEWDRVCSQYFHASSIFGPLYESIELTKQTDNLYSFTVTLKNKQIYTCNTKILTRSNLDFRVMTLLQQRNVDVANLGENLKLFTNNDPIYEVAFYDSDSNTDLTGNLKYSVFELLHAIEDCVRSVMIAKGMPRLLIFHVSQDEAGDKKLRIYHKIFKSLFTDLNREYIDVKASVKDKTVYLWHDSIT